MLYALESRELLAPATSISPYTPNEQLMLSWRGTPRSAHPLSGELFRLRLLNNTTKIAVPYLRELVKFTAPMTPDLEAAAAFAQTPEALQGIADTLLGFNKMCDSYLDPDNTFNAGQAGNILHIAPAVASHLIKSAQVESVNMDNSFRRQRYAGADLERLYEWRYPASFPLEQLNIDNPALS